MQGHVHTGFIEFVYAGASAIVMIHLLRFLAAKMIESKTFSSLGKSVGSLVTFSGE